MDKLNQDLDVLAESTEVNMPVFPLPALANVPIVPFLRENQPKPYPFIPMPPIFPVPGHIMRPNENMRGICKARFLHAAANYGPVTISIGPKIVTANLSYGNFSDYEQIDEGFHFVTVMSADSQGTVLLRKEMPFRGGDIINIAIINTAIGIGLVEFLDKGCSKLPYDLSCFHVVNLSYNSMPIYTLLDGDRMIFQDTAFKEATSLKRISPDVYNFTFAETTYMPKTAPIKLDRQNPILPEDSYIPENEDLNPLLPFQIEIKPNMIYTVYLIGLVDSSPALQAIISETPIL